jgi:hypothetical protein
MKTEKPFAKAFEALGTDSQEPETDKVAPGPTVNRERSLLDAVSLNYLKSRNDEEKRTKNASKEPKPQNVLDLKNALLGVLGETKAPDAPAPQPAPSAQAEHHGSAHSHAQSHAQVHEPRSEKPHPHHNNDRNERRDHHTGPTIPQEKNHAAHIPEAQPDAAPRHPEKEQKPAPSEVGFDVLSNLLS